MDHDPSDRPHLMVSDLRTPTTDERSAFFRALARVLQPRVAGRVARGMSYREAATLALLELSAGDVAALVAPPSDASR